MSDNLTLRGLGGLGPTIGRAFDWVVAARSHRVLCLLLGLWIINGFDVVLTVHAHDQGMLDEQNPIAAALLMHSPVAVLLYKVALVTFGSAVLYMYRSQLLAELAAFGVLGIYTIVAIQWRLCYELYMVSRIDGVSLADVEAIDLNILTISPWSF